MHSSTGIVRVAGVLLAGVLALFGGSASGDSAVTPGSKAAGMDACVAPTDTMRRNHMDFLKHDRDKTVHKGIRDTQYSLAACVDCHAAKAASGGFRPVDSDDQFCSSCHEYVAVSLTCFQCHSNKPKRQLSSLGAHPDISTDARQLGLLPGAVGLSPAELDKLDVISREVAR